jgi:uncharacterized protein YjbJ (UPF0337 family)
MKDSIKNNAEGTLHEAKGAVKEAVGHGLNRPDLEAEGQAEKSLARCRRRLATSKQS